MTVTNEVDPVIASLACGVDRAVVSVERSSSACDEPTQHDAAQRLLAFLDQLDRLNAAAACLSTVVDDDGTWASDGSRSFVHWLAARTGMSFVRARELVVTGRALRDRLPATRAAALAGAVGTDQVRTMVKVVATSDVRCAALAAPAEDCGEEFLVAQATQDGADGFRRLARRWAAAADPEADERGYREAGEREFLALAATLGGYHLSGFLTTEHGAAVNAALDAVTTPPPPDDQRTTQQRRAQSLADLSRLVLDRGLVGTGAAVRPHLNVVVDFETLRRAVEGQVADGGLVDGSTPGRVTDGAASSAAAAMRRADGPRVASSSTAGARLVDAPRDGRPFRLEPVADVERFAVAEVVGAGPIPQTVLARLACDSAVSRVVFSPESQVINVGRAERTYVGPRRKAVIARDGTCRYPGCTAPPALGEIHHVAEWVRDGGETDVNTGVLLCWHHHDVVHRHHVQIRPSPGGGWSFSSRHGVPLGAVARCSAAPVRRSVSVSVQVSAREPVPAPLGVSVPAPLAVSVSAPLPVSGAAGG